MTGVDTMVLIWGMQEAQTGPAPAGQDVPEMRRRAEILIEELSDQGERIVVPTVMVAELLAKIEPRKYGDFIATLQERFFCPPLDLRASALAAELWQRHRSLPLDQQLPRIILKADVLIVATARVAGARIFYSHEPKCRKVAELAGMESRDLPVNPGNIFRFAEQEIRKKGEQGNSGTAQ